MKRLIGAALALLLVGGCTSSALKAEPRASTPSTGEHTTSANVDPPSPTPTPTPTPPPDITNPVGTASTFSNSDGSISIDVTIASVKDATKPKSRYGDPPANGHFAVVDILIDDTAGEYDYNPFDFSFQEPDGTTWGHGDGNAITAGFEPELHSGTLTAGQKIRAFLTFDVRSVQGGLVQMTGPAGKVIGQWKVS